MKIVSLFIILNLSLSSAFGSSCSSLESSENESVESSCHTHHDLDNDSERDSGEEHDCMNNCCVCCASFYIMSKDIHFVQFDFIGITFTHLEAMTHLYHEQLLRPPITLS